MANTVYSASGYVSELLTRPKVQALMEYLKEKDEETLSVQKELCAVNSPSNQEEAGAVMDVNLRSVDNIELERICSYTETAVAVYRAFGMEPVISRASSTDSNIPTSPGIPAVTLGRGGRCYGTHALSEHYDPTDAYIGVQRNCLLLLAAAEY